MIGSNQCARPNPSDAPATARTELSASKGRSRSNRPAPKARRMPNSCCRSAARASRRIPRLPHAISKTRAVAAHNKVSGRRAAARNRDRPLPIGVKGTRICARSSRWSSAMPGPACSRKISCIRALIAASARSNVTPGLSRIKMLSQYVSHGSVGSSLDGLRVILACIETGTQTSVRESSTCPRNDGSAIPMIV